MITPTQADIERAEKMASDALGVLGRACMIDRAKPGMLELLVKSLNLPQLLAAERENVELKKICDDLRREWCRISQAKDKERDQLRAQLTEATDALKAAVAKVGELQGQLEESYKNTLEVCGDANKLRKQLDAFNHWTSQDWRENVKKIVELEEKNAVLLAALNEKGTK